MLPLSSIRDDQADMGAEISEIRGRRARVPESFLRTLARGHSPGVFDQLRSIFEVHRIDMLPFSAPDESVVFKQLDQLTGNILIAVRRCRQAGPPPIAADPRIQIDGGSVSVHAQ